VQSRARITTLKGTTGKYLLVGDQRANGYAINAQTGSTLWQMGPVSLTGGFQAPAAVQLNDYSDAAFQAAVPGNDLVFFALNEAGTNNGIWAVLGSTGAIKWSIRPGGMNRVSGAMAVDYGHNHLFVATGVADPALWVFNTLDGSVVASLTLGTADPLVSGASSKAVNLEFTTNQALVTPDAGWVHAIDLVTLTKTWSTQIGPTTSYVFPINNGFIASLVSGQVQRYSINPVTYLVTPVWATPPAMSTPSGVWVEYTGQKIYVGDSTGKLHQLDAATGAESVPPLQLGSGALATPTIDTSTSPKRLHVNSVDGRLCAVAVPF
jgi:hypothetical protein